MCLEVIADALAAQDAQFDLRHIQPTAVLGCVVNIQFLGQPFYFVRFKGLIHTGDVVCVELIHHQYDLLRIGVQVIAQFTNHLGEVFTLA